jgi:transitional endoplasmic reticulum ATPase
MLKKQGSELDKAVTALTTVLEHRYETSNAISRDGTVIVIPEYMTLPEASDTIMDYQRQMEDPTEKRVEFIGHPNDTLHAFNKAMHITFGNLIGSSQMIQTFFGPMKVPSQSKTIQIGPNQTESVPWGHVKVPGLPIAMDVSVEENETDKMNSSLWVDFSYKKKFEPMVDMIEDEARKELKNHSIFLHKAIDSRFNFLNLGTVSDDSVIYTSQQRKDVEANLFNHIVNTETIKKRGASLKRAILLHGTYGTSKTLTALLAATKCIDNEWTFLSVLPGDDISRAFEFAKRFQPCMVFFEDIDQVASGARDEALNRILNTCDGILSKSAEVVTVMTTNNVNRIQKGMLRPGRIDVMLELGSLDADAMVRMVELYCPDIEGDLDGEELEEAGKGYTPAFVTEACQRALLYSISDGREKVRQADVVNSLRGLRSHYESVNEEDWKPSETLDGRLADVVAPLVKEETRKASTALGSAIGRSISREVVIDYDEVDES